jgi:hypothetical protein
MGRLVPRITIDKQEKSCILALASMVLATHHMMWQPFISQKEIMKDTETKRHDIVQRKFDGRWMVWSMIDNPDADLDWHRKSGLPVPQVWVPIYVAYTEDEARRASKRSRI